MSVIRNVLFLLLALVAAVAAPPAVPEAHAQAIGICGPPPLPPCHDLDRERELRDRERELRRREREIEREREVERRRGFSAPSEERPLARLCITRTLRCRLEQPTPIGARCECFDEDDNGERGRAR